MSKIVELRSAPELTRVVRAASPSYRKHKAIVVVGDRVSLSGTYWSGGSRSTYIAVNIATGAVSQAPSYNPTQFGGPREEPVVEIPDGVAIVSVGTFCGKTATATVHINTRTAAPLLPQ